MRATPATASSPIAPTLASPTSALVVTVLGGLLAANSLLLGTQLFFDPRPYSVVGGGLVNRAYYVVLTLCLLALSQAVSRLDVPGRNGRRLPTAVLVAAGLGAAIDACARWTEAFVVPYLAERSPELLDDTTFSSLQVAMFASWSIGALTLSTIGAVAFARRVVPRSLALALIVAPLLVPVLGPLTWVLSGVALALFGIDLLRSGRLARRSAPTSPLAPRLPS